MVVNENSYEYQCNLFESNRSKEEINWAISRYEISVRHCEDYIGHIVSGKWYAIIGFLTYVYNKSVSEVIRECDISEC